MNKKLPSKFDNLVETLQKIPTIGKKSALRIAYYLTLNNKTLALSLAHALEDMVIHTRKCKICNNISEDEVCQICCDDYRNSDELCIVNSVNDLFILEELRQFNGKYFVIENIEECDFTQLEDAVKNSVKEIIFAISPSYENDHLILKIEDQLQNYDIKYSKIAQGVPTGVSLENLDSLSILRSFQSRVDA